MTTAAGILVTAAVGMMVGMEFYLLSVGTTLLTFLVLFVMGWLRDKPSPEAEKEPVAAPAGGAAHGG